MLSKAQEKLIRSLNTKKGREESGFCLVEGGKVIETARGAVEYVFGPSDSPRFASLVTTETPQSHAAVARIPQWSVQDIAKRTIIVVLDEVQDPGNVGAIVRLCLGFDAGLVLIDSADITSPKVIRASVGALFQVPWIHIGKNGALKTLKQFARPCYRLEKRPGSKKLTSKTIKTPCLLIAGSEGHGIRLKIEGESVMIPHNESLESLNVGHALAIALYIATMH